jgi:hypothetical protein
MISIPAKAAALFAGALSFAVASSLLLYAMIGKVNHFLPEDKQISYLFRYPGKVPKIKREYKRLYPNGKLTLIRLLSNILSLLLLILCAIQLGAFH